MKKYFYILILITLCSCDTKSQNIRVDYGFEEYEVGSLIPKKWFVWGTYNVSKDSLVYKSGSYSSSILSNNNEKSFGSITYQLPHSLPGEEITLIGHIKTRDVKGSAGLLLRIDKEDESLEFENMYEQNINGSNDWKKYEISVPNHQDATAIYIGGMLTGSGKAWFDDFSVFIDGERYQDVLLKSNVRTQSFEKVDIKEFKRKPHFYSNFEVKTPISENQIDNLYELCKEWGYLKYHNPLVASGKYNWDRELFKVLPITGKSFGFEEELMNWKKSFEATQGQISKENHYVEMQKRIGNPIFKNEPSYSKIDWEDKGYKLLSLFRLWNMIEYFYPSKYLTNDWDKVLKKYIPEFLNTDSEISYKLTVLRLITEINDTHSTILQMGSIIESFFGVNIAPIEVKFIQDEFVVTNVFDKSLSVRKGDVITKINGKNIEKNINILEKYAIGSNKSAKLRDICLKVLRTNEKYINLTFKRGTQEINSEVFCYPRGQINFYNYKDLPSHKELDNDIGYIYLGSLKKRDIGMIMEKFRNKKGIIIDIRCYPSDFVAFKLSKYFLAKPTNFVKFSQGSIINPGKFDFKPSLTVGKNNLDHYKGKVAILVNEFTQSQAEYTTMALKTIPDAKVVGSQTAGADGNISNIVLPGNISTMISGIGVYYPDGRETQGVGIIPDIKVDLTIDGVKNNKDEILERAIQYILKGK